VAILPTISAKFATGELKDYKSILMHSFKMMMLMAIPSMILFILLNRDIVILFKFSANFDAAFIDKASRILMFFAFAIVTQSVASIMFRSFYAINDTKTPLYTGILSLALTYGLNLLLWKAFNDVSGMAIAYTLSSLITAVILLLILNRKLAGIGLREMALFSLRVLAASLPMGAAVYGSHLLLAASGSKWVQIGQMLLMLGAAAVVYIGAAYALRIGELTGGIRFALGKAKRLLGIGRM
jgi:putative peptidoglycan lipid II flippase